MPGGNEVLSPRKSDAQGRVAFEAGLSRGEGALSPAMLIATDAKGDYAFLNLKGPAFDLSDRGVKGRPAAAGLDAFVYTERGVYRSGETVHVMSLLRDAQGAAALNVPLTLVVERPDGIEYRRVAVPDQGAAGARRLSVRPRRRAGRDRAKAARRPAADRRQGQSELRGRARQGAGDVASARSQGHRASRRSRRPGGGKEHRAAGRAGRQHGWRQAAVLRPLARRGRERDIRRRPRRAGRQDAGGPGA